MFKSLRNVNLTYLKKIWRIGGTIQLRVIIGFCWTKVTVKNLLTHKWVQPFISTLNILFIMIFFLEAVALKSP